MKPEEDAFGQMISAYYARAVSKEEMKEILDGTGWKVEEFIVSEGSRYIAIIKKVV